MPRIVVRIDFDNGFSFGPGKAQLLELIQRERSMRRAAKTMGIVFARAWHLVQSIERTFGGSVVIRTRNGSTLSSLGLKVLRHYRTIQTKVESATCKDLSVLSDTVSNRLISTKSTVN